MFYRTPDARLHAETYNDRAPGAPIIFVHGLGGCARSWGTLPILVSSHRRSVILDLRGCGSSERGMEPISLARLADDVLAAVDSLRADRAHLIGHSLGGVIVQDFLIRHGTRCSAAVLISTSTSVGAKATANWQRLAEIVETRGYVGDSGAARGFAESFVAEHPNLVEAQARISAACDAGVYAAQARAAASYDYSSALADVRNPVLVVQGLADRLTSPGGSVLLARALPNSELLMIDGAGHNLHLETGARLAVALDNFLDRHDSPG